MQFRTAPGAYDHTLRPYDMSETCSDPVDLVVSGGVLAGDGADQVLRMAGGPNKPLLLTFPEVDVEVIKKQGDPTDVTEGPITHTHSVLGDVTVMKRVLGVRHADNDEFYLDITWGRSAHAIGRALSDAGAPLEFDIRGQHQFETQSDQLRERARQKSYRIPHDQRPLSIHGQNNPRIFLPGLVLAPTVVQKGIIRDAARTGRSRMWPFNRSDFQSWRDYQFTDRFTRVTAAMEHLGQSVVAGGRDPSDVSRDDVLEMIGESPAWDNETVKKVQDYTHLYELNFFAGRFLEHIRTLKQGIDSTKASRPPI